MRGKCVPSSLSLEGGERCTSNRYRRRRRGICSAPRLLLEASCQSELRLGRSGLEPLKKKATLGPSLTRSKNGLAQMGHVYMLFLARQTAPAVRSSHGHLRMQKTPSVTSNDVTP